MAMSAKLKESLDQIHKQILGAERIAKEQVSVLLKKTDSLRKQQVKALKPLLERAKKLKDHQLAKQVDRLMKDVEAKASHGLDIALDRLDVSKKSEVEKLNKTIHQLQKRLEELERSAKD